VFGPGFGEVGFGLTRLSLWVDWAGVRNCFRVGLAGHRVESVFSSLLDGGVVGVDEQFRLDGGHRAV
jgi:hypothetical protein